MPLNPAAWKELLKESKNYLDAAYGTQSRQQPKKGFISFSWEKEEDRKKALQTWLSALRNDLKIAALEDVFLDIYAMDDNLQETMLNNLRESDVVLFICNPRFIERLKEATRDTGLGFEFDQVLKLVKTKPSLQVIVILQGGSSDEVVPAELKGFPLLDFRDENNYQKSFTGFRNLDGLVPTIYKMIYKVTVDESYQKTLYKHYLSIMPQMPGMLWGRDEDLGTLTNQIESNPVSALLGSPGVGKSAVAIKYANERKEAYEFIRYLKIDETSGWNEVFNQFAADLGVEPAKIWDVLAVLGKWLIVIDGNLRINLPIDHKTIAANQQRLLLVQDNNSEIAGLKLFALSDKIAFKLVQHYLPNSNLEDLQKLTIKCAYLPKELIKVTDYIMQSPWLDLADYIKYELTVPTRLRSSARITMQQVVTETETKPVIVQKWSRLKAVVKSVLADRTIEVDLLYDPEEGSIMAEKLRDDLIDCGLKVRILNILKKLPDQLHSLIIMLTPGFKRSCTATLEHSITAAAEHKLVPLIMSGDFNTSVPTFLKDYLIRVCTKSKNYDQEIYERMLMRLVNPLGVLPALCGFKDQDQQYKRFWHQYCLNNLPETADPFVGREDVLAKTREWLQSKEQCGEVAITGTGGFGKSTLAMMYANRYQTEYDFIRILSAEGGSLDPSLLALAQDLALDSGVEVGFDRQKLLNKLKEELTKIPRSLLIFDNVEHAEAFRSAAKNYLPELKVGQHILVTSRAGDGWSRAIPLEVFTPAEANAYLLQGLNAAWCGVIFMDRMERSPSIKEIQELPYSAVYVRLRVRDQEKLYYLDKISKEIAEITMPIISKFDDIIKLFSGHKPLTAEDLQQIQTITGRSFTESSELGTELGYLPLALNTAIGFIKQQKQTNAYEIADYLRAYREKKIPGTTEVLASLKLALSKIKEESLDSLKLLQLCAFLGAERIVPTWFGEPQLLQNMSTVYESLMILSGYSMLGTRNKEIVIHRLMQEAIQQSLDVAPIDLFEKYLLPLTNTLSGIYPQKKADLDSYNLIKHLIPHLLQLVEHLRSFKGLPKDLEHTNKVATISLLDLLANGFGNMGNFTQQTMVLEQELAIKKELYGVENIDYMKTLFALAEALSAIGKRKEQALLLESAVEIYMRCKNFENREWWYANTLSNLMVVYELLDARDQIFTMLAKVYENDHEDDKQVLWALTAPLQKSRATPEQSTKVFKPILAHAKDPNGLKQIAFQLLKSLSLTPEQTAEAFTPIVNTIEDSNSTVRSYLTETLVVLNLSPEQKLQILPKILDAAVSSNMMDSSCAYLNLQSLNLTHDQADQCLISFSGAKKEQLKKILDRILGPRPEEIIAKVSKEILTITKDPEKAIQDLIVRIVTTKEQALKCTKMKVNAGDLKKEKTKTFSSLLADLIKKPNAPAFQTITTLDLTSEQIAQIFKIWLPAIKESSDISKYGDLLSAAPMIKAFMNIELTLEQTSQAFPVLLDASRNYCYGIGGAAFQLLGSLELTPEQTEQVLTSLLSAADGLLEMVRQEASETIGGLQLTPEQTSKVFTMFLPKTKNADPYIRRSAFQMLGGLALTSEQTAQVFTLLLNAIKEPNDKVKRTALQVLGELDLSFEQVAQIFNSKAFSFLLAATEEDDRYVRQAVFKTLGDLELTPQQTSTVFAILLATTEDLQDYYAVNQSVSQSLGNLTLTPDQTAQLLTVLLIDEHNDVRQSAHQTLMLLEDEQKTQVFDTLYKATLGNAKPCIRAVVKETLGNIYGRNFDYKRQLALLEQALKIKRNLYGIKHKEYAKTLGSLGKCHVDLNNIEAGIGCLNKALFILQRCYGNRHKNSKYCEEQLQKAHEKLVHGPDTNIPTSTYLISQSSLTESATTNSAELSSVAAIQPEEKRHKETVRQEVDHQATRDVRIEDNIVTAVITQAPPPTLVAKQCDSLPLMQASCNQFLPLPGAILSNDEEAVMTRDFARLTVHESRSSESENKDL